MEFRFHAHDARTGEFLHVLPTPAQAQIGDVFGERGTLELTYSAHQARAVTLPTFVEVRAQVQYDGGEWEDVGPAFIRLGGSHEGTDAAGMRTVTFVGREWLLGRARVSAGDTSVELIDGKRPFYQATAGEIMRTLLLEAKDRGAAAGIDLSGFSNTRDTAGNLWSERVTIYYSPGLPIGDVLQNLVDQGLCDYRMNGRVLELYEPETTLGRDLTTGSDPVRIHGAVSEAPDSYTLEDLTTSALLIGEEGFQVEVDNPSAPDEYGRLEVTIEQGGVNSEGTARTLIDAELQRGSREIREITRTQHSAGARALPYRDYRCGDFVQVHDQGAWVRYRVRELQLVREDGGWTIHTVLNDRLQELLLRLAKKQNGIVNGSRGSGGDGTRPAPPPKPGVEPAAPQGLVVDQQVYLDASGTARGLITAGWGEVTQSTSGLAIDIGGYELWWRVNDTFAVWTRAAVTSGDTEVDHSPVVLEDGDGQAMEYQWRVRAIARESNRPGPFSSIVTLTMEQDTTPPPPPSAPTVETGFRIVTVAWDGLDENGQPMPRDFAWTRIYLAATESMADARRVGSLGHPGSWNSDTMPADVPVWVAMTAVDRAGNESAMTPAVSVTPRALVSDEDLQDALDDMKQEVINEVELSAAGNFIHNSTSEPVDDDADKDGDLWQQWTSLDAGGRLLSAWRHDGSEWILQELDETYLPLVNIGTGTYGSLRGARIEANSVQVSKLAVTSMDNLVRDPKFLDELGESWPASGGAVVVEDQGPDGGVRGLSYTSGSGNQWFRNEPQRSVPAEAGEAFRMSVWVLVSASVPEGAVRWSVGTWDSLDIPTWGIREVYAPALEAGVWARVQGIVEVVGGTRYVSPVLTIRDSVPVGVTVTIVEPEMIRAVSGSLVVDGAITADKLAANAVEADTIAAGAIDGKMITGATIRTSASGARVQMTSQGFYAYGPSNVETFSINGITGAVNMTGNLTQANAYGQIVVGPDLYTTGATGGPAISFPVTGAPYNGYAGIYAVPSGVDGKPSLHFQGPSDSDRGSTIELAASDGTSQTGLFRVWPTGTSRMVLTEAGDAIMRGSGDSYIGSYASNNIQAEAAGGSIYLRSKLNTSADYSRAHITLSDTGSITLRTQQTSNSDVRGGYIHLNTDGAGVYAGAGASGVAARNLWLRAYGNAYLAAFSTGANASAQAYVDLLASGTTYWQGSRMYISTLPASSGAVPIGRVSGQLHSVSSSRKYKLLEEPIDARDSNLEDKLLSIPVKTWVDRTAAERLAAHHTAVHNGEDPEDDLVGCGTLERFPGVVAEDLHDAGLNMFVGYEDGEPEWVLYDRIGPALIPIIKRLRDRVDALETQIGATS